jgi:hypothetical protein
MDDRTPSMKETTMTTAPTHTIAFDTALRAAAALARTRYPGEAARIDRGLTLALNGHVTFDADGTCQVRSEKDAEVQYRVTGGCDCRDASTRAPGARCKHRWAKCVVKKAYTLQDATPAPVRYYATYYPPIGGQVDGMAEATPYGYLFCGDDGEEPQYVSETALALGGDVALVEAQRAVDGENLGTKFGQPQLPAYPATQAWLARHA